MIRRNKSPSENESNRLISSCCKGERFPHSFYNEFLLLLEDWQSECFCTFGRRKMFLVVDNGSGDLPKFGLPKT